MVTFFKSEKSVYRNADLGLSVCARCCTHVEGVADVIRPQGASVEKGTV